MTQPRIPGVNAPLALSEKEHQQQVIEMLHVAGFIVAHFHPLRTKYGWKTPAAADGAGFPDIVAVGRGKILFRELKTDRATFTRHRNPDQFAWIDAINENGGDAGVWRPRDMRDVIIPELGLRLSG